MTTQKTPTDNTPVQIGAMWYTKADNYRKGFADQKACAAYVATVEKGAK